MTYKEVFLIGITNQDQFVFMEVNIDYKNYFCASFDIVRPFNENKIDWNEYFYNILEDCPKDVLYDYCVNYDCSPNDLANTMSDNCPDVEEWFDCFPFQGRYSIDIGDCDWYFEFNECGQIDITKYDIEYIDEDFYNKIVSFWKKYHMHRINDSMVDSIKKDISNYINSFDEYKYVVDKIDELFID